jgi:hypothetical protein
MKFNFLKAQSAVYIGISLAIVVLAYLLYKKIFPTTANSDQTKADNTADAIDTLENQNIKLSYLATEYDIKADSLETALFNNGWYGIDEETVYAVFSSMNNQADLLQLITAFGNRRMQFQLFGQPLAQWIQGYCSPTEKAQINTILSSKNITTKF